MAKQLKNKKEKRLDRYQNVYIRKVISAGSSKCIVFTEYLKDWNDVRVCIVSSSKNKLVVELERVSVEVKNS